MSDKNLAAVALTLARELTALRQENGQLRQAALDLRTDANGLRAALYVAQRQIIIMAEAGTQRLRDYGCCVDPAPRTWEPILALIEAERLRHSVPGHTDLMVSPEAIDAYLADNPPPDPADMTGASDA